MLLYVTIWLALSVFVASMATNKEIGFGMTLVVSLLLSPLVGFIVVIFSKEVNIPVSQHSTISNKSWEETFTKKDELIESSQKQDSVIGDIERLAKLRDAGHLTETEFQDLKQKILSSKN